jgi:hypothetical protein
VIAWVDEWLRVPCLPGEPRQPHAFGALQFTCCVRRLQHRTTRHRDPRRNRRQMDHLKPDLISPGKTPKIEFSTAESPNIKLRNPGRPKTSMPSLSSAPSSLGISAEHASQKRSGLKVADQYVRCGGRQSMHVLTRTAADYLLKTRPTRSGSPLRGIDCGSPS